MLTSPDAFVGRADPARSPARPGDVAGVERLVELPAHADELLQVLDAALRLDRALGLELGEVAGATRAPPRPSRPRPLAAASSTASMSSSRSRTPPSALPVTPAAAADRERVAERDALRLRVRRDLGSPTCRRRRASAC